MKEQVEARPKRVELLLRFVESVGHTIRTRRLSPIQAELATQTMLGFLVNVVFFIDL